MQVFVSVIYIHTLFIKSLKQSYLDLLAGGNVNSFTFFSHHRDPKQFVAPTSPHKNSSKISRP